MGFSNSIFGFFIFTLILINFVDAARIGLVIDSPDNVKTECIEVETGDNGYVVLKKADASISFDDFGGMGHMVKCINGVCKEDISYDPCWESNYWARYDSIGGSGYTMSFGSLDGSIDPYSASHGDVLGWAYGYSNFCTFENPTMDSTPSFCEICDCSQGKGKKTLKVLGYSIMHKEKAVEKLNNLVEPQKVDVKVETILYAQKPISMVLADGTTGKEIPNAEVEVFSGVAGMNKPKIKVKTDENGFAQFQIASAGDYNMRITAYKYPHEHIRLKIHPKPAETTSTTTTTTTSIAPTTTTTIELPKHFIHEMKETTTSVSTSSTTTLRKPEIIGHSVEPPKSEGGLWTWIVNLFKFI